jgi:hypothetical protein
MLTCVHVLSRCSDEEKSALTSTDYHLPALRVAQAAAISLGGVFMVPNSDLGSMHPVSGSIHSAKKPELGRRVALAALAAVYEMNSSVWSGPKVRETCLLPQLLFVRNDHLPKQAWGDRHTENLRQTMVCCRCWEHPCLRETIHAIRELWIIVAHFEVMSHDSLNCPCLMRVMM